MKRLNFNSRYQFISFLHELLYFFITSFILFPSHVKRIIFCFVYSKNHHSPCIYPTLKKEILQLACTTEVSSITLPQHIHKDEFCIPFSLESNNPSDFVDVEIDSKPSQISAPFHITDKFSHQIIKFHDQPTAFQIKIKMNMFKPLRLPYFLHPYPLDCFEYLPQFSGENPVSVERHLESFEDFIDRFEIIHEDMIIRFFSKVLIKDATIWFKSLRADSIRSWIEFSNSFSKHWGKNKSLDSYLTDFYALKRDQDEALLVFNRRFYRIYYDIPLEI
jgi:hypothetical protein